jgi:hypothetical protein
MGVRRRYPRSLYWECALREFLEGFTTGMMMLGAMLVLTALADRLL